MKDSKVMVAHYMRSAIGEEEKLREQERTLKEFSKAKGYNLRKTYTDAGCSGSSTDRPALQDMLNDMKDGMFNKIVAVDFSRISRDAIELKQLMKLVEENDCEIEFADGSNFLLMANMLSVFAQYEKECMSERIKAGIKAAKERKQKGEQ